jgi:DNA repair photolyase
LTIGTKEWCPFNINICKGCTHNCRYCYAMKIARRFKRILEKSQWKIMRLNDRKFNEKVVKRIGRSMFPTTHDITPEFLDKCIFKIKQNIEVGNSLLIVTKPHLECIKAICDEFSKPEFSELILFRFTIGHYDQEHLKFWEPGAPTFSERSKSLEYAYNAGFKTSISMEPLLTTNPQKVILPLNRYVTESIWIGTMNYVYTNEFQENELSYYNKIQQTKNPLYLLNLRSELQSWEEAHSQNKIRWKDSVQSIFDSNKNTLDKFMSGVAV